ncbi:MAG: hypothetical protein JNJ61_12725 [Anaerolineae bacterium]|nr:hypothetical protein [Anaerolineae bacterium]
MITAIFKGCDLPTLAERNQKKTKMNSDYNRRQYNLMLHIISLYQAGEIVMGQLLDDLSGLQDALIDVGRDWHNAFQDEWGILEITFAVSRYEQRKLDDQDRMRVEEAIEELKQLIRIDLDKLPSE